MSKLKYKDSNGVWQSIAPSQKEFDDFKTSTNSSLADMMNLKKPLLSSTQKTSGLIHVMAGLDSLTNGAGNTNWGQYFAPRVQAELGYGGLGFVGFQNTTIQEFGGWNVAGFSSIESLDQSTAPAKYSLDNKGMYVNNGDGTPHLWCYFTNKNFKNVKL
jgi:hypothetical protein